MTNTTIEGFGSTSLVEDGSNYFLYPNGGSAVELSYAGAPVVTGQFDQFGGPWAPIGAEQTASGYEVAWKVTGADQYMVWNTDSNGNFVSTSGVVSGTSAVLESFETSFQQDLNGDGLIGLKTTVIEEIGSTRLEQHGSNYFLYSNGGSAVELSFGGAPVEAGQFDEFPGQWALIGAEQTASGYVVAWKVTGADQFEVWNTDNSGNFVSSSDVVSGTSAVLESFETSFQQDLNGDGLIGLKTTVIEEIGSTRLEQHGSNYFLYSNGGSAVELSFGGAPVEAGQFDEFPGQWALIGAEQTASGYVVAWKVTGADQFEVWNTDNSGNFVSSSDVVSGTSAVLESFETSFQQDLNGDGLIGLKTTVIEEIGSTRLEQHGSNYFLYSNGGSAVELSFGGAPVEAGQFDEFPGQWALIGAEQTASGYVVAWKVTGADQFEVWNTDNSGNFVSSSDVVSGTSAVLESFETSFQQDLNGDGLIGLKTTVIEEIGSTRLEQHGSNYFLYSNGGSAVELSFGGAPVEAGQFDEFPGQWALIGAEQTASGYVVAWKVTGADQFEVWNTDNSGNFVSSSDVVSGTSAVLESFETSFQQDLNGDSVIGPATVIEGFGSTRLVEGGSNYFLDPNGGSAVELSYAGAPVVAGQFDQFGGPWAPIGAEQTASGYVVAWKVTGADQYMVWNTDNSGDFVSSSGVVSGTNAALQSFETSFQQDLNGDGVIGPATVTEGYGSTRLVEGGSNYFLDPNGGSAVELSYGGAPVVAGQFDQFGSWAPIGAEQTASGYVVAWKVTGADQFQVWNTDNSGNFVTTSGVVSGTSAVLQSFETSFQQDLNGDGLIGPPPPPAPTVIEGFGSTSLVEGGSNYFLDPNGGSAVELSYGGAPVVAGQFDQFGSWAPIGAEQTASGYVVAWKVTGADQFQVWNTDNSGNFVTTSGIVSGTSAVLQSFETSFQQDLNGDGVIGPTTVIEGFGSTSLVEGGSNYFLDPNGGSAVELSYGGAPVVAGQFDQFGGPWAPIGAEQTASGYVVAWKVTGADQFEVWNTDNSGNFVSSAGVVSGTSAVLESFETSFHQDLNGDGMIGPTTVIEEFGSNSLVEGGSNYFLDPNGGSAVELSYGGAPVVAGQFDQFGGHWVPIGAEQTASGYEVAWKVTGADQFQVWNTDLSGNFVSSAGVVSGTSAALQSFEASFQQDLNGDGVIGSPPHFVYQGVDGNGAQLYSVTWDTLGSQPFAVRVLAPDHPSTDYEHNFLFALPVEPGLAQSTYGSGLDELQQLDVQNQYNATIIEPIFPIDSWYANSATDATINFEAFMATVLPAWVDGNFATSGTEEDLLIGFSKSGYGGLDLLFEHPSVFDAIAAFDFPADMAAYNDFGSSSSGNYGTDSNFQDNYRMADAFIDTWKAPFTTEDRILISEGDVFATQVADFDALLTSQGVEHTLLTQTSDAHSWSGGWLSDAVAGLYGLETNLRQTVIEGFGSTSLVEGGSNYFLDPNGGSAVELSYAGAPVVAGQFDQFGGHWVPIGAEQTASGYEVAWKVTGADQYTVWNTNNSGNYISSVFDVASGTSAVLQSFETSFHQDLNSDGSIGSPPPPPPKAIEGFGSTSLVESGSNYFLDSNSGSAVELSYGGAPVVAGQFDQFGSWAPIGAEQTASGYELAWKVTGVDQFTVWNTDNSGNYVSSAFDVASGTSAVLESFETSFQQDLNGDGYIGLVLNGSSGGQTLTAGSTPTTLIGGPNDILIGGAGADTFVFPPNFGANTVNNFAPGTDALQFSQSMFADAAAVLSVAQQAGSDVVINHDSLDVVTLQSIQLTNLHASDIHII